MTGVTQAQWSVKQFVAAALALLLLPLDSDSPPHHLPGRHETRDFPLQYPATISCGVLFNEEACLTPVQRAEGGVMERDLCRGYVGCVTCDSVHISRTSTRPLTMNQMRLAAEPCEYLRNVLTRLKLLGVVV